MKEKHIADLLPEYLDHLLNDSDKSDVEEHLKKCAVCSEELEELKILFNSFEKEEKLEPSDSVRANFFEKLEEEKQNHPRVVSLNAETISNKNPWSFNFLKIAAGIALLVGSFMLGKKQQEQKSNVEIFALMDEASGIKEMTMLALMENKSASKRIQGVNYIEEFSNPDEAIVNALADRMLHDENTNVRLSAVEALGKFTASGTVKNDLILALKSEKDPGIQIAIIQILVQIQEKKAVAPMQELLQQEDTQPYVKKHIETVLPSII